MATAVVVGAGQTPAFGTDVSTVIGSAYGYYTNVSLGGGPYSPQGPAPTVTLPSTGGSQSANDPDGASAVYGPAVLFESGALTVDTSGSTGAGGSVTSTSHVVGFQDTLDTDPDGDGPGPFLYQDVVSTCTRSGTSTSASATITGGILETKYDSEGNPIVTEAVPTSPA
ncbi:MAG: hypothetical protein ACRD0M_11570, partial [Acidimicrobiales bacterium]